MVAIAGKFYKLADEHDYVAALQLIATLRAPIDLFFENVMVMDDDAYVRWTRLSLLHSLVDNFSKIADFSEIVTQG
jgi:glycyl-tRNA synthetase beta chain